MLSISRAVKRSCTSQWPLHQMISTGVLLATYFAKYSSGRKMTRGTPSDSTTATALADVQQTYHVDSTRIYLMGHSMGGYGTWSIAMNHPDIFAALGPISGGGAAAGMAKISHIPEYVTHGDDDRTVPVTQSRTMVEAGRKASAEIDYVEVPGGSHSGVAAGAIAPMFDFFVKQHK